jgi:post-segregation antitoxin (ccd killing protein)
MTKNTSFSLGGHFGRLVEAGIDQDRYNSVSDCARAVGLNVSALAEEVMAPALGRIAQAKFGASIARACSAHEQYLAEYGSLGDAIRAGADAAR